MIVLFKILAENQQKQGFFFFFRDWWHSFHLFFVQSWYTKLRPKALSDKQWLLITKKCNWKNQLMWPSIHHSLIVAEPASASLPQLSIQWDICPLNVSDRAHPRTISNDGNHRMHSYEPRSRKRTKDWTSWDRRQVTSCGQYISLYV